MKERLSDRVRRMISGSFNAIVNAVENVAPEVVMEEAIREIDGVVDDVRIDLGKVIANKHMANSRLLQANGKLEELNEKIELAVTEDRDDLAEAAISQQIDIEAQLPILENQISDLGAREKELEGYIAALQGKKREMAEELRLFRESRREAAVEETGGAGAVSGRIQGHEVRAGRASSAFERVLGRATGAGSLTGDVDRQTAAKLSELEDLSRQNRIKERLAVLKNKVKG